MGARFGDAPSKVTWLLPVKNGMPYLPETLASIEAQSYPNWEILAWDNGSTDGTVEELRRWIPDRLPGRLIVDSPLSLAASLAEMVRRCETELCARIDADDVNLPGRLKAQIAYLESHPDIAAVGSWTTRLDEMGEDHGLMHILPGDHAGIVRAMLKHNAVAHPTVLFRRAAVLGAGNYADVPQAEDYELWLRMAAQGYRLANLEESLVRYRFHAQSATQRQNAQNVLQSAMDRHLSRHARALYGVSEDDLMQLRSGQHPALAGLLRRIARHLHQTGQDSAPIPQTALVLLRDWRQAAMPADMRTRFALVLADGGRRGLPRAIGRAGQNALKKVIGAAVGPWGRAAYGRFRAAREKREQETWERRQEEQWQAQRDRWLLGLRQSGANIHPSIEFLGDKTKLDCLEIAPLCHIERDASVWISPDIGANPSLSVQGPSYIGRNTYLGLYQPIRIGAWSMIGAYCYLITGNHNYQRRDIPIAQQGYIGAPILIEEDVWLGTHVVVLPGVTIGKGAIVAAGSIVNKDIPPYEIWGGTPAKFLRQRPD